MNIQDRQQVNDTYVIGGPWIAVIAGINVR